MNDARQFNIRDHGGRLLCPACGFPGYAGEPPYDERGVIVRTTICPCCLWEPGFDDEPLASEQAKDTIIESLRAYRRHWNGAPSWQGVGSLHPVDFDGRQQLARLFDVAPELR